MGIGPGNIANLMPDLRGQDAQRKARDLARTQREQSSARTSEATQIGAGGITLNGGSIEVTGGGSVDISGGGKVTVAGLVVNATSFGYAGGSGTFGPVLTAPTAFAYRMTVPIPMGYSTAIVQNVVQVVAVNHSGATDTLLVAASINSIYGALSRSLAAPLAYASATAAATRTLTGLVGGGTVTIDALAYSVGSTSWGTDAANLATVNGIVIFSQ